MTAEIYQLRDYQNKKDLERLYAELRPFTEEDTAPSEMNPGVYTAPERDPA